MYLYKQTEGYIYVDTIILKIHEKSDKTVAYWANFLAEKFIINTENMV